MAVDFSRWSRREFADVRAPCGRQGEPRPRASLVSAIDASDRRRIATALLSLGRPPRGVKRPRPDP